MYLFFMISGFLFVTGLSVLLKFIYEIFPINKITNFLSPTEESVFNNIGKVIIPNILWALIEVSLLGSNYYFLLGFILNIFVSMSTIYVIEYGYRLIINKNKNNNLINIISIITGSIFGFSVNYLCLLKKTMYFHQKVIFLKKIFHKKVIKTIIYTKGVHEKWKR